MSRFVQDVRTLPASLDEAADEQKAAGATSAHAARMLDAIDLLERRVTASFASLREEAEDLLRGLENSGRRTRRLQS